MCEGVRSAPSSEKKDTIEESGCVEGVLIEIEQADVIEEKSAEVWLADEGGEELDLIVWEEVKEGKSAHVFSLWTDTDPEKHIQ